MGAGSAVKRVLLIWSYERGTLQYDIMCALILAFVFFVPRSCFIKPHSNGRSDQPSRVSAIHTAPLPIVAPTR
jgi:hypothetical protein